MSAHFSVSQRVVNFNALGQLKRAPLRPDSLSSYSETLCGRIHNALHISIRLHRINGIISKMLLLFLVVLCQFWILFLICFYFICIETNGLHAVTRTQRGTQREPNVKTLHSPLSAEIWRHCVLNGGTQRRVLPRNQSEEMKILI